jgi:hypothetical protein
MAQFHQGRKSETVTQKIAQTFAPDAKQDLPK